MENFVTTGSPVFELTAIAVTFRNLLVELDQTFPVIKANLEDDAFVVYTLQKRKEVEAGPDRSRHDAFHFEQGEKIDEVESEYQWKISKKCNVS